MNVDISDEDFDRITKLDVPADFSRIGEFRRRKDARPYSKLVSLDFAEDGEVTVVWQDAGEEHLRANLAQVLILRPDRLDFFAADAIAMISAASALRECRLRMEQRKAEAERRALQPQGAH